MKRCCDGEECPDDEIKRLKERLAKAKKAVDAAHHVVSGCVVFCSLTRRVSAKRVDALRAAITEYERQSP